MTELLDPATTRTPAPTTVLPRRDELPASPPPPEARRSVRGRRQEDDFAVGGALMAALALSYLVYFVLLPFSGLLGFVLVTLTCFVLVYGLLVSLTASSIHVKDKIAAVVVQTIAVAMLLALVVVVGFTFKRGASALTSSSFYVDDLADTGPLQPLSEGGVAHAMLGTAFMITIALVLTVPLGIVTAVYLSETRSRFGRFVRTIVEAMTALPSVIAGLAVYAAIILLQEAVGIGEKSGLAAACALAVMMLPIVIRAADVVLRLVPGNLKEAAAALGAPRWRIVWHVVLPTSKSGVMTAVILGTARGIGETSPVLLTAGYTTAFNLDPTSGPMVSLPLATFILTRSPEPTQIARGFGAAAVLMVMVLILFVIARVLGGRGAGELSKRQRRLADRRSAEDAASWRSGDASARSTDTSAAPHRPRRAAGPVLAPPVPPPSAHAPDPDGLLP